MKKIIVIGHKNPDTDSIVSSLAMAEYFKKVLKIPAKAFRAGEINKETKFMLKEIGIKKPSLISTIKKNKENAVALVDHNELSQVSDKIDFAQVSYIIDHHKLLVQTEKPIFCRVEPLGSTATIIAKMFQERKIKVSKIIAKLLLAGILSDTLNLVSPTTTVEDKKIARWLNKTAQIKIKKFANEMFEAKSSLTGISIKKMFFSDYKLSKIGKYKVGVGVWETTNPGKVNEKVKEIVKELKNQKKENKLNYLFFMTVDILKQNSYLFIAGSQEEKLAKKIFKGKIENGIMFLEGIVSRKKQVIPPIVKTLK